MAVWVVPIPPIEATIGMNTARVARLWMEPSNSPMTEAASTAVARLINRQRRRLGKTRPGGIEDGLVAGDAAQPLDVLGGLLADDVDHVVHADGAEQAAIAVHHRHLDQVVALDQARHLLLVGVDAARSPRSSRRIARTGVAGSAVSSRCSGTTPTR